MGGASSREEADAAAHEREFPGSRYRATTLVRRLEIVGGMVEASIAEVARAHGLSHAALNALAVIEGAGRPVTAGEIGKAMHITSGSITSVVDTLVAKGLVQRFADPDDRRRVLADITPAAEDVLDALLPEVQARARHLAGDLTDAEITTVLGVLQRVEANAATPAPQTPASRRRTPKHVRPARDADGRRTG